MAKRNRRKYSPELKAKIVLELLKEEKTVCELSSEYGIHATQLTRWRAEAIEKMPQLFAAATDPDKLKAEHEKEVEKLYSEIGRLTTQLSWLKKKSEAFFDQD